MEELCNEIALSHQAAYSGTGQVDGFHRFTVAPDRFRSLMEILLRDSRFWCDQLISLAGVHHQNTIQVHYHLASIPTKIRIHVSVSQPIESETLPEFVSVADLWKSANWHERETAELFGIRFIGHPDPRNLLLPANWEGFPLRKDYVEQENFHGIRVKYEPDARNRT